MEKPRHWTKELRLPCALEHAVLQVRVFERQETWTAPSFRTANPTEEHSTRDIDIENGLVFPPEDPLAIALDRVRKHHDDAADGVAVLRCWGALVEGSEFARLNDSESRGSDGMACDGWPPPRDSLAIFEISDGILTETGGMLRGIELVEVISRRIKLSDALHCSSHPQGRCPGCRHRYKIDIEPQALPTPRFCTPLSEIEVFSDTEARGNQRVTRELWSIFGRALVDYYAYMEDWLPELVMARRCYARETISVIPTSTDSLNINFEAVMMDNMPKAPLSWALNDNCPSVGTLSQIWPTSETALFLKTMHLIDSPRLESRLLTNVARLLGKRSLEKLSIGIRLSGNGALPVAWALLWVPYHLNPDSDHLADIATGEHRLWPKVLLTSSTDTSTAPCDGETDKTQHSHDTGMDNQRANTKKSKSLFKEALEMHIALARIESEGSVDAKGVSNTSEKPSPLETNNIGDISAKKFPAFDFDEGDWRHGGEGAEDEEEEDLFASSPSPALVEETRLRQGFESSQDKPVEIESVDRVSASMFTPTLQPETGLEPTKYDVSPGDQQGRSKAYNTGFESMITDDDFNFFDIEGEGPVTNGNRLVSYEEYGDLSGTDFGINMNQTQSPQVSGATITGMVAENDDICANPPGIHGHPAEASADIAFTLDTGAYNMTPVEVTDTPEASIRSDDDLWNDDSLAEQHQESALETDVDIDTSKALSGDHPPFEASPGETHLPLDVDMVAPITSISMTLTPARAVPTIRNETHRPDYSLPLLWTVVNSVERTVPTEFSEVSFNRPLFAAISGERKDGLNSGLVCVADIYGDGRVKNRRRLVEMLESQESLRREKGLGLLPFHAQSSEEEVDIGSPRSTESQHTHDSEDSADDASEIASTTQANEQGDWQGIFTIGYYPFPDHGYLAWKRKSIALDEQDCASLRRKIMENRDSGVGTDPVIHPAALRSLNYNVGFEMALIPTCEDGPSSVYSSPLRLSIQSEYNGSTNDETDVRVRVGLQGNVIELSSQALSHWSDLSLEPIGGRHNVRATILYQTGISMSEAKTFFRSISKAYATLNFGFHTLVPGGQAIRRVEGDLTKIFDADKPDMLLGDVTYVLLFAKGQKAKATLQAIDRCNRRNRRIAFPTFLRDLSHPKAFSRLSSLVYHLLRQPGRNSDPHSYQASPQESYLQHAAFTIAAVPENNRVRFALRWPAPVLDIIEGERTLHVTYWLNVAAKSVVAWLIDDCGQAWKRHISRYMSVDTAVQDVWAFAMVFAGKANVHWRFIITKYDQLSYSELRAWHSIFQQESQAASGTFAGELVVVKARHEGYIDGSEARTPRIRSFLHRQCLYVGDALPAWVSPLCSVTIDHPPSATGVRPASLDIHLLLRMSPESVGMLRSDMEVLVRIGHQFEGLRALGIHRWFFSESTPWPAHVHAVQLEAERQEPVNNHGADDTL